MMRIEAGYLISLVRDTIGDPRGVARRLMAMNLPMEARWLAFAAVVTLSVFLVQITVVALALPTAGAWGGMPGEPVAAGAAQAAVMLALSWGIARVGRAFGGRGSFADALLLVTWVEFVLVCLQVIQLLVMIIFPFSAMLIGFAGLVLFFWLLTHFTAELHGFRRLGVVFFGILAGLFVGAFVLVLLLGILGLGPAEVGV